MRNHTNFFSLSTFSRAASLWPVPLTQPQRVTRLELARSMVPSSLTGQMEICTEEQSLEVMTRSVQSHLRGRKMSVHLCLSFTMPFILVSRFLCRPASIGCKYSNLLLLFTNTYQQLVFKLNLIHIIFQIIFFQIQQ